MMLNNLPIEIILSSPGSIAFEVGKASIRWYGIFIACGFLFSYLFLEQLGKKNNLNMDYLSDLIIVVLLTSIIFARLWFVILSFDYFKFHLDEVYKIWYGGQSIQGGILGGILATFTYTKIKKLSFYTYADILATCLPLAQAIGRWGNFFNNEAYGLPVNHFPIKLFIPFEYRPINYLTSEYFHPTFLYESVLNLILFIFLYKIYPKWKDSPGKIFWSYLFSYSIIRFFIEFIRIDGLVVFNLISAAHFISIITIVISGVMLVRRKY